MKRACSGVGADCRKGKGFCKDDTGRRDEVASVSGASRQVCAGGEARSLRAGQEGRVLPPAHRPRCRGAQELRGMEPEASADSQITGPELGATRQSRRQRTAHLGWEEGIKSEGLPREEEHPFG